MFIKELTMEEFTSYAKNSSLSSYMQTKEYARFMAENGYNYDFIGLISNSKVVAASLILYKKIGIGMKYGYAPKGFLVNYYDEKLLEDFTELLKKYYSKKGFVFIKINPEIVVGTINSKEHTFTNNPNNGITNTLTDLGYKKLKNNIYFESMNPRFEAYIDLKNSNYKNYSKACRNKVNNSKRKGLKLEKIQYDEIDKLQNMLINKDLRYYKDLYSIFDDNLSIDFFTVKVYFEDFIKSSEKLYNEELDKNLLYNEIIHRSHKTNNINTKMKSDSLIATYKNEISFATEHFKNGQSSVIAYAIVIRNNNRAVVFESNFDRTYPLNQNYFLYDSLINYYKEKCEYLSLGGVSGDLKKESPFYTLNRFKLSFDSKIYEFIGEFDLIISRSKYEYLLKSGKLSQEFDKKA